MSSGTVSPWHLYASLYLSMMDWVAENRHIHASICFFERFKFHIRTIVIAVLRINVERLLPRRDEEHGDEDEPPDDDDLHDEGHDGEEERGHHLAHGDRALLDELDGDEYALAKDDDQDQDDDQDHDEDDEDDEPGRRLLGVVVQSRVEGACKK